MPPYFTQPHAIHPPHPAEALLVHMVTYTLKLPYVSLVSLSKMQGCHWLWVAYQLCACPFTWLPIIFTLHLCVTNYDNFYQLSTVTLIQKETHVCQDFTKLLLYVIHTSRQLPSQLFSTSCLSSYNTQQTTKTNQLLHSYSTDT